jgi:DNA-binding transcriptional regulator GbsR (MarR family)
MIGLRLSPDKRMAVEAWAKTELDKPSLSEAVRRLVELGLASAHRSRGDRKPWKHQKRPGKKLTA